MVAKRTLHTPHLQRVYCNLQGRHGVLAYGHVLAWGTGQRFAQHAFEQPPHCRLRRKRFLFHLVHLKNISHAIHQPQEAL